MLVEGYLAYRARLFGVPARRRRALIDRSIELGSLGEVRSKRIGTLSKGFRQRVGLAAATLHEPGLLVLDEPANGLDPTQIRHMRETIRSLAQSSGVLLSSHILAEVELTCDRVVVVAGGRVLADGSPAHLRSASAQGNSIHAEIPEAAAMAATIALRSIGGVRSVDAARSGDGWRTLQISLDPAAHVSDAEACTRISQALHSIGVVPRTLAPESPTLERAFHQLLESAARQNKPEGAAA
jgi:ABC-2 type transport system ATP-binding protein